MVSVKTTYRRGGVGGARSQPLLDPLRPLLDPLLAEVEVVLAGRRQFDAATVSTAEGVLLVFVLGGLKQGEHFDSPMA